MFELLRRGRARVALLTAGALLAVSWLSVAAMGQSGPNPDAAAEAAALPDAPLPDAPLPQVPAPQAGGTNAATDTAKPVTVAGLPREILRDQAAIWTLPVHLKGGQWGVATVLVLATAVTMTADRQIMRDHAPTDKDIRDKANTASDAGVAALAGLPAAMFLLGSARGNSHWRETGLLAGEAMADGFLLNSGIKLATWRERPNVDKANGKFYQRSTGWDSSFPSSHAAVAWSAASVLAHESDSFLVKAGVYGTALGVSAARVVSNKHFPSDALVGTWAGWLVGRYVFNRRHREAWEY